MIRSPFHPGFFLRKLLAEHQISQTRLARHIRVQIGVINQICNEMPTRSFVRPSSV